MNGIIGMPPSRLPRSLQVVRCGVTAAMLLSSVSQRLDGQRVEGHSVGAEVDLPWSMLERSNDEASHEGDLAAKVKALEEIDKHVVGPVLAALRRYDAWRILELSGGAWMGGGDLERFMVTATPRAR